VKAIGESTTIRWYGPLPPNAGDVIRTTTGRKYVVTASSRTLQAGKRSSVKLTVVVVPRDYTAPAGAAVRSMRWLSRKPKVFR